MVTLMTAAGVGLAVKAYAEFDEQMSKVQAATHASSGEMAQLREAAINAGADTAFSAKEAGQAIEELSKAGVSTADILNGGLNGALSLAAAGSLSVADAAELAATAMVQFKLSGSDIPHVADLLAAGAGKAQGSVEDMGMALKQGGLVASSFGISVDETVGSLAAFASAGLVGSDAGTSMKTMLLALANPSKQAANTMAELGISAYDASGNFVGMSKLAGNLQGALGGLTQEQRNSALATIFGSDAIRTANVLYEQGAKGIQEWTDKVNDSGYAALTASINQNNLKGDIERLTGSIDSVFLKSGSGMNDMLRSLTRGAEGLVDAIGQIPAPMLTMATSMAGVVGGLALVSGGILMAIPKIMAARAAWQDFATSNTRLAGSLGKLAKGAGVAVAALAALQILDAIVASTQEAKGKVEDFNQALVGTGKGGFDKQFQGIEDGVNGVGDAFARLTDGKLIHFDDALRKMLPSQPVARLQKSVDGLDQSLSGLVKNGGLPKAAQAFNMIASEADNSAKAQGRAGMSASDVLKLMPEYTTALKEQATQLGVAASDTELLEMAQGRIPEKLAASAAAHGKLAEVQAIQKGMSEEVSKALAEIGLTADGTVIALDKFVQALFRTADAQLNARDTNRAYIAALQDVDAAIKQNGTTLDLNTAAGRANEAAFDAVAAAGMRNMAAMAQNGASQQDLQAKLGNTYNDLIGVAGKFGITGGAADELARKVLGIPKGVSIQSWMSDEAKRMAEQIAGAVNGIPNSKTVNVLVSYTESGTAVYDKAMSMGSHTNVPGAYAQGGKVQGYASGGMVDYLATGGLPTFRPNGTDTVPAMLTPGEVVVKRSSARAIGYEQLAYANATGRLPGAAGGPQSNVIYNGPINVTDVDQLMRKQDTARRDALAMLGI
jgi:TP901 family phage tail tape measure protein